MYIGSLAASAMNAFSVDMQARAHNIANVNTPEFKAQTVTLTSGPQDHGVLVGRVHSDSTPGSLYPGGVSADTAGGQSYAPGYIEGSNTDVAREYVHMSATQRAYEANALMVRAQDDMAGMLLDMKV